MNPLWLLLIVPASILIGSAAVILGELILYAGADDYCDTSGPMEEDICRD